MQVVRPIDIEDALRVDLGELAGDAIVCAQPAPDDLVAMTVCVVALGGGAQTQVSHEYDVSVDCWAATWAEAQALACEVAGIVASLPYRTPTSGRHYVTASAMPPYINPDPRRPLLPRATFRATVGLRGVPTL